MTSLFAVTFFDSLKNVGTTTAARIATMTTTIISSMSVNPRSSRCSLSDLRRTISDHHDTMQHGGDRESPWGIAELAKWTTVGIELDQTTRAYITALRDIAQRFTQRDPFFALQ